MKHFFSFKLTFLILLIGLLAGESHILAQTPAINYTLPRAGNVSLAIYDAQGRQVRTLLAGESLAAGKHELNWDGLDRLGNAMPVGAYEWRLLMNDGLEADYVAVVGQTPINAAEPWVWTVGSHQGPSSVVVGAGGAVYHGSRNSEGPPVLMKLGSENGPVLWSRGWQSKGPVDMVELGAHLYVLGWTTKLQRVNAATGQDDGKSIDLLWPGEKASKGPRLDDGEWHHVAFVWNQSGGKRAMHLYLDAQLAATGTGPETGQTDHLSLGLSNQLQGQAFIGSFDEIRIYQRSLTAEEIIALANRELKTLNHKPSTP